MDAQGSWLAIDQGGHASRALLFDTAGDITGAAEVPIATRRDGARVEHDPDELAESVTAAVEKVLTGFGGAVTAAGLATQRSSIVCWDRETGAALSPVISWQDRRTAEWLRRLAPHEDEIRARSGLVLTAHYGASKMRWCLEHLPGVADAHRGGRLACGPLASFLLQRLLTPRRCVVDPANASRTQLWDPHTGDWSPELCRLFGVPAGILPDSVPSAYEFGALGAASGSVALRVCTGDQPAALFGFGKPRADTIYINVGTGAFLQRPLAAPVQAPRLLHSVVWRSGNNTVHVLEGTVNGAGSALQVTGAGVGLSGAELDAAVTRALDTVTDPPLFMNAVSGLGSPFWIPDMESAFEGEGDTQARLAAVAESIVFLLCVNLEVMAAAAGTPDRIVLSGGLARMDGLCRRLADCAEIPVHRIELEEATCRGLAWLLAGRPAQWRADAAVTRFVPGTDASLSTRYQRWRKRMNDAVVTGRG